MLHILLLILKIIGITLGILIGIIILAVCLALFVPLHYRIEIERNEGESNPPIEATAKVTWLLHFINMRLQYSSELKLRLRVLFFTIFRLPAKEKKNSASKRSKRKNKGNGSDRKSGHKDKKKRSDRKSEQKDKEKVSGSESEQKNEEKVSDSNLGQKIEERSSEKKSDQPYKNKAEEKIDNNPENSFKADNAADNTDNPDEENSEQKLSLKEKLIKIWEFFQNIWYTIKGLCDRIKGILENIEYYLDIIKGDIFKSSFALCKDELYSIFSYIKPRTFKTDLVIGTGDPASTGQVLAYYYAVLYPILGPQAHVQGDFEQKRIEGTALIKGKIKLFTFIKAAVRIYFNKDIRKLLKLFKKEDE
ncbi:MAG: DUF2953 domain-containing protein [Lachnospiraceae bacterium]|nr:DUF2953 domain-containing protein [Lachnospiraceae bacterium]